MYDLILNKFGTIVGLVENQQLLLWSHDPRFLYSTDMWENTKTESLETYLKLIKKEAPTFSLHISYIEKILQERSKSE